MRLFKNKLPLLIVFVLTVFLAGCSQGSDTSKSSNDTKKSNSTSSSSSAPKSSNSTATVSGSKVEDAYVELRAQTTYHTQTNNQSGWTAQNEKDLFAKYGVTKEEVDAFSKGLRNDPSHAKAVVTKQLQRLQELQKTGI